MKGKTVMDKGDNKMKKVPFGIILLVLAIVIPIQTMAQVGVSVSIGLPPPIEFAAPPDVIVMPDTPSVYVVPGIEVDLFFWSGWWWRPWQGRWYRSRYYNRNWGYYGNVPSFYFDVDPGWRGHYRDRNWYGHPWHYEPIPHHKLQQNWKGWQSNRYWEKQKTWGVQSYKPRPQPQRQELRQQRQHEYQQRPEVQQHQQQRQQQQKQPQVRQPTQQPQERVQQPRQQSQEKAQRPKQQPQEKSQRQQRSQPQGRNEGGGGEKQDKR